VRFAGQHRRWPFDVVWNEVSARETSKGESSQFSRLRRAGEALSEALTPRQGLPTSAGSVGGDRNTAEGRTHGVAEQAMPR
jgi:hypothetical protein